jgi:hypothetical protein
VGSGPWISIVPILTSTCRSEAASRISIPGPTRSAAGCMTAGGSSGTRRVVSARGGAGVPSGDRGGEGRIVAAGARALATIPGLAAWSGCVTTASGRPRRTSGAASRLTTIEVAGGASCAGFGDETTTTRGRIGGPGSSGAARRTGVADEATGEAGAGTTAGPPLAGTRSLGRSRSGTVPSGACDRAGGSVLGRGGASGRIVAIGTMSRGRSILAVGGDGALGGVPGEFTGAATGPATTGPGETARACRTGAMPALRRASASR